MPAQDLYHNIVKNALLKDGWTITHDPFHYEEKSGATCDCPYRS